MGLALTFNTVRYLRPVQVLNRVGRTLFPWRGAPALPGSFRLVRRAASPPAGPARGGFDGKSFEFLNRRIAFEGPDRWRPPQAERLWVYNLHYFQYLPDLSGARALALMRDWTLGSLHGPGWEPYPLSLRIREWIEWLQLHPGLPADDERTLVDSVALQATALDEQIEYHLLGNHILENAITLCWAGLSLQGPSSRRWLERGERILGRELGRQCLKDGSHEERSPMYQALLAESLLRLAELARAAGRDLPSALSSGGALLKSLAPLVHPDGRYAQVNDSTQGVAASYGELCARFPSIAGEGPRPGAWALPDAGYHGWRDDGGNYLLFDAGPLGPDHQPGHGHADALAFVLDRSGRPLLTDTGVGTYEPGAARGYDRGTAAHNTVEVDGRDQSELWGAFRCGRRARVVDASSSEARGLEASYQGPGTHRAGVRHRRRIAREGRGLTIRDDVAAAGDHEARVRLHAAPGVWVRREAEAWLLGEGAQRLARITGAPFGLEASVHHPEFGVDVERPCLVATVPFRDALQMEFTILLE